MTARVFVDERPRLSVMFAEEFEAHAREVLALRERLILGLPGGSVASVFCPILATLAIDWTRVDIFWIDERAVPPGHPDSNYALASRLLLVPAGVPPARVHRMPAELPDLAQAARRAADELRSVAGDPPRLDVVIAGVGEDGHVASVFGDSPALGANPGGPGLPPSRNAAADHRSFGEGGQPCLPIYDAPKPPSRRLTLTLPVLAGAGLVIVAAFGTSKAKAMRDALSGTGTAPVSALLRLARSSVVLLDREAGLLLAGSR